MFCRSSKSRCLNETAHAENDNKTTVVYEKIEPQSAKRDTSFNTRAVRGRITRAITETIDLKKFYKEKQLVKLPGEVMNADDQCVLQYGRNFRQCSRLAVRYKFISVFLYKPMHQSFVYFIYFFYFVHFVSFSFFFNLFKY